MKFLTEKATLVCNHETGLVGNRPAQNWVYIDGQRVLVAPDPVSWRITGCTNANPPVGIKPCTTTLAVRTGYSDFIFVNGAPVCLDTIRGFTDGTPPGAVDYKVRQPGQNFVEGDA